MGCLKMAATTSSNRNIPKKFKWSIDLSNRNRTSSESAVPPGYLPSVASAVSESTKESDTSLLIKRSWDVALQPLKSIPMNLFMMFVRPIRALLSMNTTFKMLEGTHAISQILVYILGQIVALGLALYKCQSMGLLPTHSSDWLAFIEPQQRIEYSAGGMSLI